MRRNSGFVLIDVPVGAIEVDVATIDVVDLAGGVSGTGGGQKDNGAGHLLRSLLDPRATTSQSTADNDDDEEEDYE